MVAVNLWKEIKVKKYIVDLTNHLIAKNRYYGYPLNADFIERVKDDLEMAADVRVMTPETLGKIMGSLEIGDVMASKAELLGAIHFGGDCEAMLRELVALCLAYVIRYRLDQNIPTSIPPYNGPFIRRVLSSFPTDPLHTGKFFSDQRRLNTRVLS